MVSAGTVFIIVMANWAIQYGFNAVTIRNHRALQARVEELEAEKESK